ncbi:hypothetical protein PsYK624_073020 [Phanerochaete sordida]|uniref:Uncharacterized protein n=1 Tax=Phanerochaete sordida TaxID=48140 RepID=A0A9P3LE60_9APHY|nr:hypothetical protein PsYK624_073020 [Phanerochaete sordida]
MPSMEQGCIAVALVQRQVTLVHAARTHRHSDAFLDVHTYTPLAPRVFLRAAVPEARIAPADVLRVLPAAAPDAGVLELAPRAYAEFVALSARTQARYERLFCAMAEHGRARRR